MKEYRSLAVLLAALAVVTTVVIASCGGGGGSSNGGLCEQCGDSPDGPCQPSGFIIPGVNEPAPCPTPPAAATCVERALICRRESDSAQRRCFPADESGTDVDFAFRCEGSRPGRTLPPATITSTPLGTTTPVPSATKTVFANAVCGNGIVEGLERCDGSVGNFTCADFCDDTGGILQCNGCIFDVSQCTGGNCSTS